MDNRKDKEIMLLSSNMTEITSAVKVAEGTAATQQASSIPPKPEEAGENPFIAYAGHLRNNSQLSSWNKALKEGKVLTGSIYNCTSGRWIRIFNGDITRIFDQNIRVVRGRNESEISILGMLNGDFIVAKNSHLLFDLKEKTTASSAAETETGRALAQKEPGQTSQRITLTVDSGIRMDK